MNRQDDDLDRIMAVMAAAFDPAFGEAWTRRQVEDALFLGNCTYRLIDANGNDPGFGEPAAGFYLSRHGYEEEELLLLAVTPAHRRAGLATKLLSLFRISSKERGARRLLLEMRRGNPAEQLYRRNDYQTIGERPNYYRAGDGSRIDAITLALELD